MITPAQGRRVRFGDYVVDFHSSELYKHGIRIKLQYQPFQLLESLLENPGELVTREQLRNSLWSENTFVDFDSGLNAAIRKLRDALNDSADKPRYIETLHRHGYRFIAKVEEIPDKLLVATKDDLTLPLETIPGAILQKTISIEQVTQATPRQWRRVLLLLMLAAAVVLVLIAALQAESWRRRLFGGYSSTEIRSLAVLPLQNLSGDRAQDYFADGMTEALITDLAQISSLRIISRNSMNRYKGTQKSIPEIAKELNVDAIIEGSVVESGGRVRITAQLLRAFPERHLWAQSYDRDLQDVLSLQSQVAQAIATQVRARITPQESAILSKTKTLNPQAYEGYLKGLYFMNKQDPTSLNAAIQHFRLAIAKDGTYAPAYAGLAECFLVLSLIDEMTPSDAYARAEEATLHGLALDENLDSAHRALASILTHRDGDWPKAEAEYRRAIALNPNSSLTRLGYADLLFILRKPDLAREQEQIARSLDPLSFNVLITGVAHSYFGRKYQEALEQARAVQELYPEAPVLHVFLSNLYMQQQQDKLAAEEMLRAEELFGEPPERVAALRSAFQSAGLMNLLWKRVEMNKSLAAQQPSVAYDIANDYSILAEKRQALDWLEKAYEARDPKISAIGLEPHFDILRPDPRFQALLRHLNLPQ